ncbi:putative Neutral alpha-glucosidase AB [Blattamonas nauphoetae]|uniref:Glucosidase II subunit alpha n=1 Tax=Blattamonas nauphoetae TaxID=2049346 RepID=A0ABQ9X3Z9_9EUKA|nr:putative Neutral alpha-glucosidase AB [Blattamonas nauphoetae]
MYPQNDEIYPDPSEPPPEEIPSPPRERYLASFSTDFLFPHTQYLCGLPQRTTTFDLPETKLSNENKADPIRLFNSDVFQYEVNSTFPVYGTIPLLLSMPQKRANRDTESGSFFTPTAVLWMNAADTYVDIHNEDHTSHARFISEAGLLDFFVLIGDSSDEAPLIPLIRKYHLLTGLPSLPPLFSFGYHQCRWNYEDEDDCITVANTLDSVDIPFDVLWLDIEHTDGKRYMTWDKRKFSSDSSTVSFSRMSDTAEPYFTGQRSPKDKASSQFPKSAALRIQHMLGSSGRKLVTIVDPHTKVDRDFFIFRQGQDRGYFLQTRCASSNRESEWNELWRAHNVSDQHSSEEERTEEEEELVVPSQKQITQFITMKLKQYEANCWPGLSSWPDFFNDDVKNWYANLLAKEYYGTSPLLHHWIDMNEMSVFNVHEGTCPVNDTVHLDGQLNGEIHNAYGLHFAESVYRGMKQRTPTQRPFILTRSFFTGIHRYAAVWTGDNQASFDHLASSVSTLLSLSVCGCSHVGADVGGFFFHPTEELLVRWYQFGVFNPFFREHAHHDSPRREPYLWSDVAQTQIRNAVHMRYELNPYLYSHFAHSSVNGVPVLRPLALHFDVSLMDSETQKYANNYEMLFGDSLLVAPVTQPGIDSMIVALPLKSHAGAPQLWYNYTSGTVVHPDENSQTLTVPLTMDSIPVFQRGGTIIPLWKRHRRSTFSQPKDPFTLLIALDSKEEAEGCLFVDDGWSEAWELAGQFMHRKFRFEKKNEQEYVLTNTPHDFDSFFDSPAFQQDRKAKSFIHTTDDVKSVKRDLQFDLDYSIATRRSNISSYFAPSAFPTSVRAPTWDEIQQGSHVENVEIRGLKNQPHSVVLSVNNQSFPLDFKFCEDSQILSVVLTKEALTKSNWSLSILI